MKAIPLTAFPRVVSGRNGVKKLRVNKRVPAVIYGRCRSEPQNLELKQKEIEDLIEHSVSENVLIDLKIEGDTAPSRLALLREVQHHPVTGRVLHVDLHEIGEQERVTVMVPVETTGEAVGVKTGGGVLEHVLFTLKVRGLAKDIPEIITVDVSHLDIGQAIHIGDITPPPGVELVGDKQITVIAVSAPVSEAEETAAEAAAATELAEPEVLREKKEEAPSEEEAAEKGSAKAAAKGGEKAPEKAPAKGAEKAPEKAAEKKPEKGK